MSLVGDMLIEPWIRSTQGELDEGEKSFRPYILLPFAYNPDFFSPCLGVNSMQSNLWLTLFFCITTALFTDFELGKQLGLIW